ncbi:MAG: hypothetical protein US94_C0001G0027 [Berkelbacteria bacterium GW2011_GWB1_38_5]|uniref:Uncharacterized protein n=2 Tax=Candidatus Berkelbacteria TaxID=1618330 RepID=A0A0G0LSK0_9BACT|nr:MAG: hypothetical protein US94_C0001G0027 [Berkelbacteria bacterium GW2011_GWB1_38_5]KKQ90955.1 MAG: hypothetical protein UT15_C0002G0028 [Berkelbacteria bacterium GW2011_GWA1_39_10]
MDQNSYNQSPIPSEGNVVKWFVIAVIIALTIGGSFWYYKTYIVNGSAVTSSPDINITEAEWKTKSEKVVTSFLDFWSNSSSTEEGKIQGSKAKDLLTISAQAKLATYKDEKGEFYSNILLQLNQFLSVKEKPVDFQISSSKQIDESTVESKIVLNYPNNPTNRIVKTILENNIWLIDAVKENVDVSPSAVVSPSPIASSTASP